MTKRIATIVGCAALGAALLSACGSSTNKAPGVQPAPSAGQTGSTPTTVSVPPALSRKPTVTVPKGPPPTHLVLKDLIKGTGAVVRTGQTITANYVGVIYKTGKQFASSWQSSQPFTAQLTSGSVIPGWVEGIPGMRVGGRRELIIPPADAYGKQSQSGIPPNSTLIFVIDVLSAT